MTYFYQPPWMVSLRLFKFNQSLSTQFFSIFLPIIFILFLSNESFAQTAVSVGSGSYASSIPASENVTTDNNTRYVLPGVTEPTPTNDWWTPLITQNMYGSTKYHLWAHPLDFTCETYGLGFYYPTSWSGGTDMNKQMVAPAPVQIGGAGFAPNSELVKSWGDWTVSFRLQESGSEYADVTIGHGMPFAWIEYTGVSTATVKTDGSSTYFNTSGGTQTFPFTGNQFGFTWQGRSYAVFAPNSTNFSLNNGVVSAAFTGSARFLVVAALPASSNFATFAQYAYAIPRGSTVSWSYNEGLGELTTTWNVSTESLQGSNTNILQGFLPHHYKYTTGLSTNGMNYLTARGQLRLAAGNNFSIKYKYNGTLSHLPAPEVLAGKSNGYNATTLNNYINSFAATNPWLGESNTYGSGKSIAKFARFLADASVLNNGSKQTLQDKLKAAMVNWFTYTPGEPHTYYAYMNNFKALMGFDVGFGSEQFNDHHFHYGYHVYAAGVLGLHDAAFISQYGEMAKLVAKEYANWDRTDKRFPFLRTLDIWEGHSWANGGYGMNPPIGNNQESTSEAMMSWTGMIQLGLASGDASMTSAGVFGYVTEAAATNEYWFDRDDQNLPAEYGPAGKIACIVGGSNIEYQTFFGLNPIFVHGIQYIPVMPSSYYLVQNDKFAAAQTEFDYMRNRSVSQGYGDIGSWGDEWNNIALRYASIFNPEWAAANQQYLGNDPGEAGLSYYQIHSNRALGRRRFDYFIGAANSGVFYNSELNRWTYCAFNPTSTAKTYYVYNGTTIVGTITVPAKSFYSTHTLGSSGNNPPTAQITAPVNNSSFAAPATITINATATDVDGNVSQVAFYNGGTLLGTDTSSPYSFTWTNVAAGTYSISAIATDNEGATGASSVIGITVTSSTTGQAIPGTIQAESYSAMNGIQLENTSDSGGGQNVGWIDTGDWMDYSVDVAATGTYNVGFRVASSPGGGQLQLRNSGNTVLASINIAATGGWQNWVTLNATANLTAGTQTLRLYASSGGFNVNWVSFSQTSTNTPPSVSISSPANNASFAAPASISISANASDSDGSIAQVAFYNGSTLLGTDTSSPYGFTWTNVAAGTYSLTAKATDNLGASTTSSIVNVIVNSSSSTNLALNKPVTVSSVEGAGTPGSAAVDGNATTRWSSAFSDQQWLYVDLGANYNINRVKITWEAAYGRDYQIQFSTNASSWTTAKTVTGNTTLVNDYTNLTGSARYVRMNGTARGTVYGYSIYEMEVYGTAGSTDGSCSGTAANGDYSYQVSTSGSNVNWTFIPEAPIAGSTLAILNVRVGTSGNYAGYGMTASGNNFVVSLPFSSGQVLNFYFTYRVGSTTTERNSSANPHSYTVGTVCSGARLSPSESLALNNTELYPNPTEQELWVQTDFQLDGGKIMIINTMGRMVHKSFLQNNKVDVSKLTPGMYTIIIQKENKKIIKRFIKK